ncbi:MAG: glycosyltransferase [Eubacteriales bacterium]|nr:glycosyltransferase [Eubacteriales bacterium]
MEQIKRIPCKTVIAEIDAKLLGKQTTVRRKLKRDIETIRVMEKSIIAQNPEIIHVCDLDCLIPAYAAQRKLKCKLVYDSFEINVENYTGSRRNVISFINETIEKHIVHRVDFMVSVSNAAANYFQQHYGIKRPIVVTNSVLRREIINDTGDKAPYFEVLNHGQFYDGRGYDIMAKANRLFKEIPEVHLAVRGFGYLENSLRETVASGANADHFHFYPKVKVEELIPLASKSSVGVAVTEPICINFKLSVSNKLFEYAAAGLPVIMSDIPEHRYLNDCFNFGIIMAENTPKAFYDAVIALYQDKMLYKQLSENALKMSEEMCWEKEFEKLLSAERGLFKTNTNEVVARKYE